MKATDIVVGARYADAKGNVREIIAEGTQYVLYRGQTDTDCVRYRLLVRGKHQQQKVGDVANATRASFARWAKTRIASCDQTTQKENK